MLCSRLWVKSFTYILFNYDNNVPEVGTLIIPILKMKTLRPREFTE